MKNKLMATVNGKNIYESDVDRFIELMGNRAVAYNNEEGKKQICEELIKQELIYQDSINRNIDNRESFKKEMEEITRSILAKYYLNDLFGAIQVSDDEIKKYYEDNKDLFKSKYKFKAKHILVESEEKANEIKKMYDNGKNFEDLAKEFSICPSKEVGGDLGEFSQGQMVLEFENACIEATVNELTLPVKTQFGYHIIKLESKTQPEQLQLSSVKDEIISKISKEKERMVYVQRMNSLISKSNVDRKY